MTWEIVFAGTFFLWFFTMNMRIGRIEKMTAYLCRMGGIDDRTLREIFDRPLED